ncbi:MAG: hypothetical protein HYR55_20590 [Acidobacteria bacterium]|nr:hypothetical protein [Acidobacteriota bacterium]MBI3658628.1 hypothetical protein [Acidobacteriota bacterium]
MSILMKSYFYGGVALLMVSTFLWVGCSSSRRSDKGNTAGSGKVSVDHQGQGDSGKLTIKSDQGETVITSKAGEGDFDVPFYPGAKAEESGSFAMNSRVADESDRWSMIVLLTKDPFEMVVKFYKEKAADAQYFEASSEQSQSATFVRSQGDKGPVTTVLITRKREDAETRIHISRAAGK